MADSETRVRAKRKNALSDSTKKSRKLARDREYQRKKRESLHSAVNILSQITRWQDFKTANNVINDEQAAQMLLDHYESWKLQQEHEATQNCSITHGIIYSPSTRRLLTPFRHRPKISLTTTSKLADHDPIVPYLTQASSIYRLNSNKDSSSDTEIEPSKSHGEVKKMDSSHDQQDRTNKQIKKNVKVERSDGSSCSVDNVAIKTESDLGGLTNQDDEDDSDCVPDSDQVSYQNVYIDYDDLQTIGEGEDCELLESDRDEDIEIEADTITDEDSVSNLLKDHLSIVFDSQLLVLSKLKIPAKCRKCDGVITEELKHVGSSTLIIWMCTSGHKIERWCSQPVVRRIRVGDFLLASNILASGNNYRKIAMLFQFMNMGCVSESTFNRIQKHYCSPAITNFR